MAPQSFLTRDVPQADSLEKVTATVEAVSHGRSSYQTIADSLHITGRQGRYYRRATEILGLTTRMPRQNVSTLTPLGKEFLSGSQSRRTQILSTLVLDVPIIQSVVGMLASSGEAVTQRDLELTLLQAVPSTTGIMAHRRMITILSWLQTLGVVRKSGQAVRLHHLPPSINKVEIPYGSMPVLPKPRDLRLFEEVPRRVKNASRIVRFEIDMARTERANSVHERLRSLLAERIRRLGLLPTYNKYIDLAVRINSRDFIIEVKSSGKAHLQVRRGISQLYEYRYLQCLPRAILVLLLEKPLADSDEWLLDYLVKDRGIFVIWNASDDELFTTDDGRETLPFMK